MNELKIDRGMSENPENDRYQEAFAKYDLKIDEKAVEKALKPILDASAKGYGKDCLKTILSCIDLTSLKPTDSDESILELVEKINKYWSEHPDIPTPAALCIYPCFAELVSKTLEIEDIKVACVAGGFPSSLTYTEVKIAEVSLAAHDGADEIDIVQPAGRFMSGEFEYIASETDEIKEILGDKTLKVILETGALGSLSNVKRAALLAMYSGADFIKTSTGKEVSGASAQAFYIMCQAIKEYAVETGRKIGIKAAGGIRSIEDAMVYYNIVGKVLGKEWLDKTMFRIGASSLTGKIIEEISGEKSPF